MEYDTDPGSEIQDKHLGSYFREPNSFCNFWLKIHKNFCQFSVVDPDPGWKNPDPG
jgi:hypothetical protein